MKYLSITVILIITIFISGCADDVIWEKVHEEDEITEVRTFMESYMEGWSESLSKEHYSIMERYFVPNSQVYHMQRRNHQQIITERKIERLMSYEAESLEENQYGEYRWHWMEQIEIQQGENKIEEERKRTYYLSRASEDFRITAIERRN